MKITDNGKLNCDHSEVIISGVSGRFPKSDSVEELWQNLFTGQPLYGPDKFPYPRIFPRLPKSRGYLKDTRLFDHQYFNYSIKESNTLDPQTRILLEVVHEALWDAGIRPDEWRGTRTGFFLGSAFDDTGLSVRWDHKLDLPQYFAQRVSYFYDWHGPTMIVDTACAASLNALHTAYWSIRSGECDQAVVAGISIHLKPSITICFAELEMLSKSGFSWCLDEKADGYIRSEAVVAVVLQREPNAKRIYASILSSCTSSDGYTKEGITFPRREVQVETMKQTLKLSGINPLDVNYVEAHITGTAAGDPIESSAIMEAYRGTSDRPLMLGALKSNIGHSEASAGLCALTKVLKIFQTQLIPPNINMIDRNPRIESLREGRLRPVTRPTPFTDQIISVDAFGFGGSNTHVILKGPTSKTNSPSPVDPARPRLIFLCNRTHHGISSMIETIQKSVNTLTDGYLSLLTNLSFSDPEMGLTHRAFCLLNSPQGLITSESSDLTETGKKSLCLLFDESVLTSVANGLPSPADLFDVPICTEFVAKVRSILYKIKGHPSKLEPRLELIVNQIANAYLLKSLGLVPGLIIGLGIGKIVAKYAAGQLTLEEALKAAVNFNEKPNLEDPLRCLEKNGYTGALLKWIRSQSIRSIPTKANCEVPNQPSSLKGDFYLHVNRKDPSENTDWVVVRVNHGLTTFHQENLNDLHSSVANQPSPSSTLVNIGKIFLSGFNPKIDVLYPVKYPVERDCPSIGHLLEWKHDFHFDNMVYPEFFRDSFRTAHRIDLVDSNFSDLADYLVDGSTTLPTAGYIWMVWDHLVKMRCSDQHLRYHSFELWSIKIHRLTPVKDPVEFRIVSNPVTHQFVVKLGEETCVTGFGRIVDSVPLDYDLGYLDPPDQIDPEMIQLTSQDFYTEMSIRGLTVKSNCQSVSSINSDGSSARVKFNGNWIVFLESCLLVPLLGSQERCLKTITSLEWFRCDPILLSDQFKAKKKLKDDSGLHLVFNENLTTHATRGLVFKTPTYSTIPRSLDVNNLHHRYQTWLPYFGDLPVDHDVRFHDRSDYYSAVERILTGLDNPQDWINVPTISGPNQILLDLLWSAYKHPRSFDFLREQFTLNSVKLNQDRLLSDLQTQLTIQHLAIFEENVKPSGTINITSFGSPGYPFQEICYNQFRRIRNRYNFTSLEADSFKSSDLLIYNHESMALVPSISDQASLEQLRKCLSTMEPSSFVLIQFRKSVFPCEYKLANYTGIRMLQLTDASREFEKILLEENFILLSEYSVVKGQAYSLLARKKLQPMESKAISSLKITDRNYSWVTDLQKLIENKELEKIWLIVEGNYKTGLLGLANSLKEESFGHRIRCIFNPEASPIDLTAQSTAFGELQAKDLVINVLINQTWGSFRHFELPNGQTYVNNNSRVYLDWSSAQQDSGENQLVWCKLSKENVTPSDANHTVINHYAPLDFTIRGKNCSSKSIDRVNPDCHGAVGVGHEFAGETSNGSKVIGLCSAQGVSNLIPGEQVIFSLPAPAHWSLVDASTIVLPYTVVYYSLVIRGSLKPNSIVLLHNLADGLYEAALNLCRSMDCSVLLYHSVTESANYLLNLDSITSNQVLSNQIDLEEQTARLTDCKGIDLIFTLDSFDSLKSLAQSLTFNGKLIHLISNDRSVEEPVFETIWLPDNASYESICWPRVIRTWTHEIKSGGSVRSHLNQIVDSLRKGLNNNSIKPIKRSSLFKRSDLAKAVNQLTSSQYPLGRTMIQMVETEKSPESLTCVPCEARTRFNNSKCYVIFGGLGGVGLQLGQWMVERGACKIVLVSRKGVTKNYQKFMIYRMRLWSPQVKVFTFELPTVTETQVASLIETIQSTVGPIGGIFNLAGTLVSGLFENQTADNYDLVCSSKVELTEHLDSITRSKCPSLEQFVCFSSIGSSGILGESNYCYANSFMERVCEARRSAGLPACAIQFGAIGDVGMASDNSLTLIAGSTGQPIFSCLQTLDKFLSLDYSVLYSAISAEKLVVSDDSKGSFIQRIEHILGLQNLDSLDETITLGDLGLDSLQSIEVKDLIDKTFGLTLQNIAIGKLSIGSLLRFKEEYQDTLGSGGDKFTEETIINLTDKGTSPIFFFPPALFDFLSMKALAEALKHTVIGVDLTDEVRRIGNLHKIAEFYSAKILEKYPDESKYYFVGYSYGCLISFEVAKVLQKIVGPSRLDCVCFIDATPYGLKRLGQLTTKAALLGLPGSEVFCIAMDHLGVQIDEIQRERLLEAEDDDERYMELVTEIMASAGMNGPAEGLINNPVANIDRQYYLTHMDDLGTFDGDALFIRVLSKLNHGKPSTVCEGLDKIISGKIKEVLYNASHFDVLKVYAKEIAHEIEEMMPPDV